MSEIRPFRSRAADAASPRPSFPYFPPAAPCLGVFLVCCFAPPTRGQSTPYQQAVLATNPALYWTFDEEDDFGNAYSLVDDQPDNELVPTGAASRASSTTTAGGASLGRAARFDHNEDPQSRFHAFNLAPTDALTAFAVEFWFLLEDDTPQRYFSETFAESGGANQPGVIYNFNASEFELFGGGRTGAFVSINEWHHVVAAYYGPGNGVEIHIDGEPADTIPRDGGFNQVHSFGEFAIGNTVRNPQSINGMIDEYAIYDLGEFADVPARQAHVALIASHYRVGNAIVDPRLVAPSSVDLGLVTTETPSVPGAIEISNLGIAQTLTIAGLAFGGPDSGHFSLAPATVFPLSLPPGASNVIGFSFTSPGEPGAYAAVATLASNDPQAPQKEIAVSVTVRPPDPPPATPYQQAVVGHGPVLYWTFDEMEDTDNARSLVDNQPANELVAQGAATRAPSTSTTGGVSLGRAARFDHAEDTQSRFYAPNLARTDTLARFAVEFWFLLEDDMPERYLSETFTDTGTSNRPGFIYNYNFEELELFAGGRTGINAPPGEWHHLVAAHYGSGEGVEIWLDGELAETIDRNGGFNEVQAFGRFAIGNTVANPQSINGMIDEYAIYDLDRFDDFEARQAHVMAIAAHHRLGGDTGPEVPFHIVAVQRIANGETVNFELTFTSSPGRTYTIQTSADLRTWTELDDNVASGGESTTFRDPRNLAGLPILFYLVEENAP